MPTTTRKRGRPRGHPKSGGIRKGQRWSRPTIADRIWRCLHPRTLRTRAALVQLSGADPLTVRVCLRRWLALGQVERVADACRNPHSTTHRARNAMPRVPGWRRAS